MESTLAAIWVGGPRGPFYESPVATAAGWSVTPLHKTVNPGFNVRLLTGEFPKKHSGGCRGRGITHAVYLYGNLVTEHAHYLLQASQTRLSCPTQPQIERISRHSRTPRHFTKAQRTFLEELYWVHGPTIASCPIDRTPVLLIGQSGRLPATWQQHPAVSYDEKNERGDLFTSHNAVGHH